jgi:colicin import membrane protein
MSPPSAPPSERETAAAAAHAAADAIPRAQADLDAAIAAAAAARAAAPDARRRARADAAQASSDAGVATDELRRARRAVATARSTAKLSSQRVGILSHPADTRAMQAIAAAAAGEEQRTRAEVARLTAQAHVQVPANEILFFPALPLRVDAVKAKRGSATPSCSARRLRARARTTGCLSSGSPPRSASSCCCRQPSAACVWR